MWTYSASKKEFFDCLAAGRRRAKRRARYYYKNMQNLMRFIVPRGSKVLEIGCGTGELLAGTEPKRGVGIDISPKMLGLAAASFPDLEFVEGDAHNLPIDEKFDYVIMSDV